MAGDWLPRPAGAHDVRVVGPAGDLGAGDIAALLADPSAAEWRHKVGVAGRSDGSGKTSTRLLAARGWVLKTNLDERESSEEAVRARLASTIERGTPAAVWHPSKVFAAVRTAVGWLPVSACRQLVTLREVETLDGRIRAWTRMIELALRVQRRCGLGLDLNPANFATEPGHPSLHYVDDEFYPTLDERRVATAMVARIPEEPDAEEDLWACWGEAIDRLMEDFSGWREARHRVADEVCGYPLVASLEGRQAALARGLRGAAGARRSARRLLPRSDRVCVFADVHANLPALEAVLAAANELGAGSYLFLGDVVGYGPHPAGCIERLAGLPRARLIGGNHDDAVATGQLTPGMNRLARTCAEWTRGQLGDEELTWLAALAPEARGDGWLAVHGAPRDPRRFLAYVYDLTADDNLAYLEQHGVPLCFHGHTHVAEVHSSTPAGSTRTRRMGPVGVRGGRAHLVNPGSVGQPRDGDARAAFAIWDRADATVTLVRAAYDAERTRRDIARAGLPGELGDRLERGR